MNSSISPLTADLFHGQIVRDLVLLSRTGGELALLLATLCGRETLEQELGPSALEELDMRLASCLARCGEACDSFGRTAPGRFALLLPGVGMQKARLMAEKLQQQFAHATAGMRIAKKQPQAPPACAVGIACTSDQEEEAQVFLRHCEDALRRALAQSRGHICVAGGEALANRATFVHSGEKRFLFFGSN